MPARQSADDREARVAASQVAGTQEALAASDLVLRLRAAEPARTDGAESQSGAAARSGRRRQRRHGQLLPRVLRSPAAVRCWRRAERAAMRRAEWQRIPRAGRR
eukprot:2469550-Prymnesium_polylepis.1